MRDDHYDIGFLDSIKRVCYTCAKLSIFVWGS